MTDPIADMLTRIRNAVAVRKAELVLPYSKIKLGIAKILKQEGFIEEVEKITENFPALRLVLKYNDKEPAISHLKRISKPGLRVYVSREDIPYVLNNLGIAIISTSRGLMTNRQARRGKIGGEVLCEIW